MQEYRPPRGAGAPGAGQHRSAAGCVTYQAHVLCNDCATEYKLARAIGLQHCVDEFLFGKYVTSTANEFVGIDDVAGRDSDLLRAEQLTSRTCLGGLTAGVVAMALGEFVSVSNQHDSEAAQLAVERRELAQKPTRSSRN
jgi:VIT family